MLRQIRLTLKVFRYECKQMVYSPMLFGLVSGVLFFSGAVFTLMVFRAVEAYFRDFFYLQGVLLLFLVPLLGMGQYAGERRAGTLDLLRGTGTAPGILFAGKLLALVTLSWVLVVVTAVFPLLLLPFHQIEMGTVLVGYGGMLLLAMAFAGIGIVASVGASGPMTAALLSFLAIFLGIFMSFGGEAFLPALAPVFRYFSLFEQYEDFTLGVIDVRRVWYYVSLFAALALAGWSLAAAEYQSAGRRLLLRGKSGLVVLGAAAVFLVSNVALAPFPWRYDFTAQQRLSLSAATKGILAELDQRDLDAALHVFMPEEMPADRYDEMQLLLREYDHQSPRMTVSFHNLDTDAALAQQYGITRPGQCALIVGEQRVRLGAVDEMYISGALSRILREEPVVVYFSRGHGEPASLAEAADGRETMTLAARELLTYGYDVREVTLYHEVAFPADCDIFVVVGPNLNFLPEEKQMISDYLAQGGNALFLVDPPPSPGFGDVLSPYGLQIGADMVIDEKDYVQRDITFPLVRRMTPHPITTTLGPVAFSVARSVDVPRRELDGFELLPLLESSPQSFSEASPPKIEFNPDLDIRGPIAMGAVSERDVGDGRVARLVVIGDSEFARDNLAPVLSNLQLFVNAVAWLAEEDVSRQIPVRTRSARIALAPEQMQLLALLSVVVVPLLPWGLWGLLWWRSRSPG